MKKIFSNNYKKYASDFKRQPGSFPDENLSGQSDLFQTNSEPPSKCKKCRRKGLDGDNKVVGKKDYQTGTDYAVVERRQTGML